MSKQVITYTVSEASILDGTDDKQANAPRIARAYARKLCALLTQYYPHADVNVEIEPGIVPNAIDVECANEDYDKLCRDVQDLAQDAWDDLCGDWPTAEEE